MNYFILITLYRSRLTGLAYIHTKFFTPSCRVSLVPIKLKSSKNIHEYVVFHIPQKKIHLKKLHNLKNSIVIHHSRTLE